MAKKTTKSIVNEEVKKVQKLGKSKSKSNTELEQATNKRRKKQEETTAQPKKKALKIASTTPTKKKTKPVENKPTQVSTKKNKPSTAKTKIKKAKTITGIKGGTRKSDTSNQTEKTKQVTTKIRKPKKTKRKLSKEELHKIRSQASKKAWETRRSKMTDKEYENYKANFVRKMQEGKAKKQVQTETPTQEPYLPTVDPIEIIQNRLEDLNLTLQYPVITEVQTALENMERNGAIPIEHRKAELLNIFQDTVIYYEEDIDELVAYLEEHEEEIMSLIEKIRYESDDKEVGSSFAQLGRILNVTSLSPSQAENLSTMSELENDFSAY